MVIEDIIKELKAELRRIDRLILALDDLNTVRRRGRPPKLLVELRAQAAKEKRETPGGRDKGPTKGAKSRKRAAKAK